ncbi:MAG: hypothetical protein QM775_12615 [Pirellulales bacterium]
MKWCKHTRGRLNKVAYVAALGALSFAIGVADFAASARCAAAEAVDLPVRLPAGFSAALYAGDDLATDISSMTIDHRGRVVVAGPGYIKTLHDDDGDGRAERSVLRRRTDRRRKVWSSCPMRSAHRWSPRATGWSSIATTTRPTAKRFPCSN